MNQLTLRLKYYAQDEPEEYLVVESAVDGVALADFNNLATDLSAMMQSSVCGGGYFILTCWCGNAECAGLRHPIRVHHSADTITWQVSEPGRQHRFVFERAAYTTALQTCIKQGRRTIAHRTTTATQPLVITPSGNKAFFLDP